MMFAINRHLRRLRSPIGRLHKGEEAQGMVFGAISLFMLAACVGLAHNSGVVTSRRIETQTAADAAAYAGALTTANIISDVAWMNDGMAYVYYNLMRYAVDVTVYRTVAEIKCHNKWDQFLAEREDYIDPTSRSQEYSQLAAALGGDPVAQYKAAYERASEMIPHGENWLRIISDMQEALGISGLYLVREAVFNTANEDANDIAAVAMVQTDPRGTVFLHRSDVEDIDLVLEYDPDGQPLWSITYNGNPYAEIYRHSPDHWEIVRDGHQSLHIYRHSENDWTFTTGDLVIDVTRYNDGVLQVTASGEQNANLLCIPVEGGWAVIGQTGGTSVSYRPFAQGGYQLTVNGSTMAIRDNGGTMQQYVGGAWQDIPTQDSVTVGGETIPISFSNHIDLPGNASLDFPNRINMGPVSFSLPNQVSFHGTTITLPEREGESVTVNATVGNVGLIIDGDNPECATLNGRSTCDPASAKKRGYWIHGVYGHDRIQTVVEGRQWIYKWRKIRSIFEREDLKRFGYHAVIDAESSSKYKSNTWAHIDYDKREGWFNVATGARKSDTAYYQTVPCWNPDDAGPNGFIGAPADSHLCPTCNPYHPLIDSDQRLEREENPGDSEGNPGEGEGREVHYVLDKDNDGKSDVRKYGLNSRFFDVEVSADPNAREFQRVVIKNNVRPLCLTDSVFAHPLLVAVWTRRDAPFLGSRSAPPIQVFRNARGEIDARQTGPSRLVPFFRNPSWGYFAVACSRVGVYSKLNERSETSYRFTFDQQVDEYYDFDFGHDDFQRRLDDREEWLASWHNLYEPVWTARLWSTSEAVKSVDMEIANRQEELEQSEDISKNFLWRTLQSSPWMDANSSEIIDPDYVGEASGAFRTMRGPRSGTFGVSVNTPPEELHQALRH